MVNLNLSELITCYEWVRFKQVPLYLLKLLIIFVAGRTTTNEELEDMLESGNPAIFTQGVSVQGPCDTLFNVTSFQQNKWENGDFYYKIT